MKKYNLIALFLVLIVIAGCVDKSAPIEMGVMSMHFTVEFPQNTRLDCRVGDKLAIIDDLAIREFVVENVDGCFVEVVGKAEVSSKTWKMVYPYTDSIKVVDGEICSFLPINQGGKDNTIYFSQINDISDKFFANPVTATLDFEIEPGEINGIIIKGMFSEGISGKIHLEQGYYTNGGTIDSIFVFPAVGRNCISIAPVSLKQGLYFIIKNNSHDIAVFRYVDNLKFAAGDTLNIGVINKQNLKWQDEKDFKSHIFTPHNRAVYLTWLESYLDTNTRAVEANDILNEMNKDGSWPDIDYNDPNRDKWQPANHIYRITSLACAYYEGKGTKYLDAIDKALTFWDERNPVCLNWWCNQIGIPMSLGPGMILIREKLNEKQLEKVLKIMRQSTFGDTGTNKVWRAHNVFMTGILSEDDDLMWAARNTMLEEVRITTEEGIQPDWSFHYHGSQPQIGTYGLALLNDISNISVALKGTPLEVANEKLEILQQFAINGPYQFLWNGYFDMNACGRQVDKRRQLDKAEVVQRVMKNLDLEGYETVGPRYYPYSDMALYRAKSWMASLRMQSNQIIGFEMTNDENMRGYFSSDGALLVRRRGDEYYDISACWNWRHVPGVTSYDDGSDLYGCDAVPPYNKTDLVLGYVDGSYMAAAMELNRDGLTGRKSWFFFPQGIVCLGSGIKKENTDQVITAVEQCRMCTAIEQYNGVIRHNNITYIPLNDTSFLMAPVEHVGEWWTINPSYSKDLEKLNILDIYIDHGQAPSDMTYSYAIIADGSSMQEAIDFMTEYVTITSNTYQKQSVKIGSIEIIVDYINSTVQIK